MGATGPFDRGEFVGEILGEVLFHSIGEVFFHSILHPLPEAWRYVNFC